MDRNSTNFPSLLTARLRRTYEQYVRMREGLDGSSDQARMAAVLKYYQYLVVEYLRSLDHGSSPDVPRGVLLYHLMGMGKTFEAVAATLVSIGALDLDDTRKKAQYRQVILVADKSLHANFDKGLAHFLEMLLPDDRERQESIKKKVKAAVRPVTMNAHNMADQVLKATSLHAIVAPKKGPAKGKRGAESDPRGALDGAMLIVDEAHNFFRAIINSSDANSNARRLFAMVMSARDLRILFMTGTPSSKHPFELVPCFNMLAGKEVLPVQYDIFTRTFIDAGRMRIKDRGRLSNRIVGLVSYAGYEIPQQLEARTPKPETKRGVNLPQLWKLTSSLPIHQVASDVAKVVLDDRAWSEGATLVSPREVVENPSKHSEHYRRIKRADTQYPILVSSNEDAAAPKQGTTPEGYEVTFPVIDGVHRLAKLILVEGATSVPVRYVPPSLLDSAVDLKGGNELVTPSVIELLAPDTMSRRYGGRNPRRSDRDGGRRRSDRRQSGDIRELTFTDLSADERQSVSNWYRPIEEVEAIDGHHIVLFEGREFRAHAVIRPLDAPSSVVKGFVLAAPARWIEEVYVHPGARSSDFGRSVVRAALAYVRDDTPVDQQHLVRAALLCEHKLVSFYAQLGFGVVSIDQSAGTADIKPPADLGDFKFMMSQFTFALYDYTFPDLRPLLNAEGEWREVSIKPGHPMPDKVDFAWAESSADIDRKWKTRYHNVPARLKNALEMDKRAVTDKSRINDTLMALHSGDKRFTVADGTTFQPAFPMDQYVPATRQLKDVEEVTIPIIVKDPTSWGQHGVVIVADDAGLREVKSNPKFEVCQDLVQDPLLWQAEDGTWRKFHLRVYMLVYKDSISGAARANLFSAADVLTAAKAYIHGDWGDLDVHITGGSRTKNKWKWPDHAAKHTDFTQEQVQTAWDSVTEVMRIVAHATVPYLRTYDECDAGFDLFGADIIIDAKGQAWLLEVNDRVGLGLVTSDRKEPDEPLIKSIFGWINATIVRPHFGLAPWPGEDGTPDAENSQLLYSSSTGDVAQPSVPADVRLTPLHELTPKQLTQLASAGSDRAVYAHLGNGREKWDSARLKERAAWALAHPGEYREWAVINAASGRAVGYVGLRPLNAKAPGGGDLQLRYFISPAEQRRGYATLALEAALADPEMGPRARVALIKPDNRASRALLEKVGFSDSGETRRIGPNRLLVMRRAAHGGAEISLSDLLDVAGAAEAASSGFSFPEKLPTIVREVEMSEQQYRQYLMAREKESSEGGGRGASAPGAPRGASKPPPALSLPGSEREGGSTYYVQSRMFGNFAPPRKYMPTGSVLDPNSIARVDPRYSPEEGKTLIADGTLSADTHFLPDDAFTADTAPKIAQIMRDTANSPGPFLVYSQFVGIGGLAVVERFMRLDGYTRFRPGKHGAAEAVTGGRALRPITGKKPLISKQAAAGQQLWTEVFDGSTSEERKFIAATLETQDKGLVGFERSDLLIRMPGHGKGIDSVPDRYNGLDLLPYRKKKASMAYRFTNLHRGQRKLFLTELFQFSDELMRDGDKHTHPLIVLYAGAAAGYHLPFIAELYPQTQFFLYDPAPFGKEVHKHPRLHVRNQFFTDETAEEWGPGGKQALIHGRPDFFVCDIRLGANSGEDAQQRFELNVNKDMQSQRRWTETIRPLRSAMLKYRPPYLDTEFMAKADEKLVRDEDTIEYLKGRVLWQCFPPRLSSETRLIVDCREAAKDPDVKLELCNFPVRFYENVCYTHNIVTRPYVRFIDHPGLFPSGQGRNKCGVPGYDGSWDARAEVETWAMYLELSRPGREVADRDIAWHMNKLSKEIHQTIYGTFGTKVIYRNGRIQAGILKGMFPRVRGTHYANCLAEYVKAHDLESQREEMRRELYSEPSCAGECGVASKESLVLSSDMQGAIKCYPLSPDWLQLILPLAQSVQPFFVERHLEIACRAETPVPIPLPVPNTVPSDLMCVHRPARAWTLALVHFLALNIGKYDCKATLVVRGPSSSMEGIKILNDLFPNTLTKLEVPREEDDGVANALLRFADGRKAMALSMHEDPTVCDQCDCGATRSFWSCWAHSHAPGSHYHMCESKDTDDVVPTLSALLLEQGARRHLEMEHVSMHIVYDRSWTRFMVPKSKTFGDQKLLGVKGYDACWDCTAEAHVWLEYIQMRWGGDASSGTAITASGGTPVTAGEYMQLLTSHCGESLIVSSSAHGHIISGSAAAAISTACTVVQHSRQHKNISRRGGAEPRDEALSNAEASSTVPVNERRYAVYTGDVSAEERAEIQRVWTSPENKYGEIIFALLLSKTGAQGLDLKYGRQTHHLEPYWDKSLQDQIDARFIRHSALDELPPDERTVQPYLYLAVANSAVQSAMPKEMLEVPVAASGRLSRGTTVDVAFHERALDVLELNKDMRQVLKASSLECALYSAATKDGVANTTALAECRMCRPTDAPLFHDELDEDLRLPDPCEVMTETKIQTTPVVLDGVTYQYITDSTVALGYRFYQKSEDLDFQARGGDLDSHAPGVYVEIEPSDPLYARLISAVRSTQGTGVDELDEFLEEFF